MCGGTKRAYRLSHNYSHRVDMHITYRPNDKNQLIFRPSFNLQTTDADGFSTNTTWKLPLETVMGETFRRSDISRMQSSTTKPRATPFR